MKKILLAIFLCAITFAGIWKFSEKSSYESPRVKAKRNWEIKSVDTMKYSRDLASEKLNDEIFDQTINLQVKRIADLGGTHVAIGTPYDEKFTPYLARWVNAARTNGLKVYFRGNFSAWEGWFGFKRDLTRTQHLDLMREFIDKNSYLFENGDVFSPCPECEQGGPGDPRNTRDIKGFRQFMISEYQAASDQFRKIEKNVKVVGSMNYDVAKLVMDEQTANSVGNLVVIDHYVKSPKKLAEDINLLANSAKANVILGELGVPIPDIHGKLTPEEQSKWLDDALLQIAKENAVIGINYWVSYGGSTAIFTSSDEAKPAAKILEKYFKSENLLEL